MASKFHKFTLPPELLRRGFWIYLWKIQTYGRAPPLFYIGMTGDTGSYKAQSPINRLSDHLGSNKQSNTLRKYAERKRIDLGNCQAIEFAAFGPISKVPEGDDQSAKAIYRSERLKVAALERALWLALKKQGHLMLNNCPQSRAEPDVRQLTKLQNAFASTLRKSPI